MDIKEIIKDCPQIEIKVDDDVHIDEQGHVCLGFTLKEKKAEKKNYLGTISKYDAYDFVEYLDKDLSKEEKLTELKEWIEGYANDEGMVTLRVYNILEKWYVNKMSDYRLTHTDVPCPLNYAIDVFRDIAIEEEWV